MTCRNIDLLLSNKKYNKRQIRTKLPFYFLIKNIITGKVVRSHDGRPWYGGDTWRQGTSGNGSDGEGGDGAGGDGEDGDGVDGDDDSFVMVRGSETGEIVMMLVTGEDHWRR